jgi:chromosome segregation ATPase
VISLEQVRVLEDRVEKAVAYIASLRGETAELGRRLAETQSFIDEAADELAVAEEQTLAAIKRAAAANEKAAAADEKIAAAEKRAEEAESLRLTEAGRIREFESRLADMAERVAAAETRAAELNARAEEYRKDQAKIEEGIVHALEKLDSFEDAVLGETKAAGKKERETPQTEPAEALAAESDTTSAEAPGPLAEDAPVGSGIAVKTGFDGDGHVKGPSVDIETVENELDIF